MDAWELEFIIRDEQGNHIVHRSVQFPFALPAEFIDKEIALMLLRLTDESNEGSTSEASPKGLS